jgi:hypothetical protein
MSVLHRIRIITSFVLAWFVLSLGVAIASPVVQPRMTQLVCTTAGAVKLIVQTDDGAQDFGAGHTMDCSLCFVTGAPPPAPALARLPHVQPLAFAAQSIPAARIAAATAAPLPARGPPQNS